MKNEVIVQTETQKRILARRKQRRLTPEKAFSLDTLSSNAEILAKCGGQAALVFRAIVGTYWISTAAQRTQGFTLHPGFVAAIGLPARQLQRATQALEIAGLIERDIQPGRKARIRLTEKGRQALVKPKT